MDWRDKCIGCKEAREMDMVAYLSGLGIEPVKIRGNNYWYLSPLRNEKTASFKINRKLNRWYDYGIGQGGNLVDFAIRYHNCTVSDFLKSLQVAIPNQLQAHVFNPVSSAACKQEHIKVLHVKKLSHPALLQYLRSRCIPSEIAKAFCREVHFELKGRHNFAVGFSNDSGGYELRNIFFKGSSSPKDITTIRNGAEGLAVFEGFMDFLSYLALPVCKAQQPVDYLILNSLSFFDKSLEFIKSYNRVSLYLDNDTAGQNCSRVGLSQGSRFTDERTRYKNHKDLNEYLVNSTSNSDSTGNDPP